MIYSFFFAQVCNIYLYQASDINKNQFYIMSTNKILFILKRRGDYNGDKHSHIGLSTGLYNSASFVNQTLLDNGIESKVVVVVDNNAIDREVHKFKPTHVIIEALWVTPAKFSILCELHPDVKWIIRLHSEIPFIANEGMAFDWLGDYAAFENVIIAANAPRALREVREFVAMKFGWCKNFTKKKVIYLPNYYPKARCYKEFNKEKDTIDIGCFGAVRPLKNHLTQAIAAVKFADSIGKKLRFHINTGRIEQKGESVINNLKGLFAHLHKSGHLLINNTWTPREEFLQLCAKMDIGMQVSFSETFNIVAADLTSQGVPVVGTTEIPWFNTIFAAKPTESEDIYKKLLLTYNNPQINNSTNMLFLNIYTKRASKIWVKTFN